MKKTLSIAPSVSAVWLALICLTSYQYVYAENLPEWSDSDRTRLKNGEIKAGSILLRGSFPGDTNLYPLIDLKSLSLGNKKYAPFFTPEFIPEEFLDQYFKQFPSGYLVDPQQLLTRKEAQASEQFLNYYAGESDIDIRLYIFDTEQDIPYRYSVARFAREFYAESKLTAVVFYFMGDPSRSLLAFGGQGLIGLKTFGKSRANESAMLKAMEKSERADQVAAYALQLSINLYWMEQDMIAAASEEPIQNKATNDRGERSAAQDPEEKPVEKGKAGFKPYFQYITVGVVGLFFTIAGMVCVIMFWKKKQRYYLPVLEMPRRLGADHAAGIGAVVAFHNKDGSPSNQREQAPED